MSTEEEPEIQTLYLEGSTAPGAPKGKRFPTDSGKLEFFTDELENSFQPTALAPYQNFMGTKRALLICLTWKL